MQRQGVDNGVFTIETNDPDRIDVVTTSSSHSDINSMGSHIFLTGAKTNYTFTNPDSVEELPRISLHSNIVLPWAQNITRMSRGKATLRSRAMFKLPSHKLYTIDGKLLSLISRENEIERLVEEIEQHHYLMQNTAVGKQIRIDTIRALPRPLSTKRILKDKLSITVTQHSSGESMNLMKQSKDLIVHYGKKTWALMENVFGGIEIWYDAMKTIEGHFGSSVGTYFKFLRWLFILNFIMLVLIFSFITLPQLLFDSFHENSSLHSSNKQDWKFLDLLTGEGSLRDSLLFYGSYTNMTFTVGTPQSYSLPHAYYVTMLLIYLCTFVAISSSMANSYRKSFIESSGSIRSMYAHKIFCSWDFRISNHKAAAIKHVSIYNELREVLTELRVKKENISLIWKVCIFCIQIAAHILVLLLIAGLGVGIWITLKYYGEPNKVSPWTSFYVAILVNVSMLVLQTVFSWIGKMEDYRSPWRALHVTLVRTFLLEGVIIGVLIYFWLNRHHTECWETSIGQEIYRLVISDLIINTFIFPIVDILRVSCITHRWPKIEKPNFDISQNSLGLVFNQTLLWMGLLFSPLLAFVLVIKMIFTFYVKKTILIYLCKSPTEMWRSVQIHTLYLIFTFLSLFGVIVTLGYIMTQVPVSPSCGPFRNYNFMFEIFIDGVLKLKEHHWVWRVLMTLIRPAAIGGILLTMMVIVYYLRAKSQARCEMVRLLKDMLCMEAKDKEYLLITIGRVAKGRDWTLEEIDNLSKTEDDQSEAEQMIESCSTWHYERHSSRNRSKNSQAGSSVGISTPSAGRKSAPASAGAEVQREKDA